MILLTANFLREDNSLACGLFFFRLLFGLFVVTLPLVLASFQFALAIILLKGCFWLPHHRKAPKKNQPTRKEARSEKSIRWSAFVCEWFFFYEECSFSIFLVNTFYIDVKLKKLFIEILNKYLIEIKSIFGNPFFSLACLLFPSSFFRCRCLVLRSLSECKVSLCRRSYICLLDKFSAWIWTPNGRCLAFT